MKLKKGFSPLEILLAMAIFSFLGTLLFQTLFQINKSLKNVTIIASSDTRYLLFDNLWEKEISGVFVPELKKTGESKEPAANDNKDTKSKQPDKDDTEKEKLESPPKAFFCQTESDGNIKLFTFITTNPLASYNMKKPRLVRIVYTVKPDNDNSGLFALYRKEIEDIFEESLIESEGEGKERSFKVFGGIKKIAIDLYAELVKKENDQEDKNKKDSADVSKNTKDQEKEEKEPREFKKLQSWDPEEIKDLAEEGKEMESVPAFIKITLGLVVDERELEHREYIFSPLYDQQKIILKGIKAPPEDPKKEQAKGTQ
jgi:hypothetical protein